MDTPQVNDGMQPDSMVYKTLLESTRAIPWKIDWASMQFAYIGPQIEALLGWEQSSWVSVNDWAERMHEEDREWTVNYCVSQSQCGIDHEADYRALHRDGHFVWIRDVVHVVRKPDGQVDSLVGFMFDITERKRIEDKLIELQKELEELSFRDGLTGVANRRMFDSVLEDEWSKARRNQRPISLIMFDIDCFKQYNDHYGHVRGDDCLRRVAIALGSAATRPRDFFARYGGEEFVLVLPETDAQAALVIAERCRALLFKEQIEHAASSAGQIVTLSMGITTAMPRHGADSRGFVEQADRQLYLAKQRGRNCIVADAD